MKHTRIIYEMRDGGKAVLGVMPERPGAQFQPVTLDEGSAQFAVNALVFADYQTVLGAAEGPVSNADRVDARRIAERWRVEEGDFNGWPP